MIREHEYVKLRKLAEAWADFNRNLLLEGAMTAFESIERADAAEVLRVAFLRQRKARRDKRH
jgi:hypothetical protein